MGRSVGWKDVDEKKAVEAIQYALDNGINHFDTADTYGNGKSERLLAKALGKKNKEVIIATKVGWLRGSAEHAYEPHHIKAQLEQSLINLKREYIDIYYFHHTDFGENDRYLENALKVMYKLKKEGKIRSIGLSSYTKKDFLKYIPIIKPDCIQSWANMMDTQFIEPESEVAKLLKKENITFVAFSPLGRGLLLDKFSSKSPPVFENGDIRKDDERFKKEFLEKGN